MKASKRLLKLQGRIKAWEARNGKSGAGHLHMKPGSEKK